MNDRSIAALALCGVLFLPEFAMAKTLDSIKKAFFEEQVASEPVTAFYLGLPQYEDKVQIHDSAFRSEERSFAVRLLADLESYPPELLPTRDRIDAKIMRAWALWTLLEIENPGPLGWNSATDISHLVDVLYYNLAREKGQPAQWEAILTRMKAVPKMLANHQADLEDGIRHGARFYRREVQREGIDLKDTVSRYFSQDVLAKAKGSLAPKDYSRFEPRLSAAANEIESAIKNFTKFLKEKVLPLSKDDGFAIGEEEYGWRLQNILFSDESPDTLFKYGKGEVEKTEKEMQGLTDQIQKARGAASKPFSELIDELQKDAPQTDAEMFTMYNAVVARAVVFVRKNKLFRLPTDYSIELTETPTAYHNVLSVAAMNPVPPFIDGINAQFWVTPTRTRENPNGDPTLLRENHAKSMAANLVVHEAIPGHDLQLGFSARRFVAGGRSDLSYMVRLFMPDTMSSVGVEGWAHYTEQLMAEQEFYSPEEHLFQLKDAQWRNVRIVVDVGIHTGRMSYDDAVKYFDDKTHSGRTTAEREIYRYSKFPLQAITYHIGKRDILELRDDVIQAVGKRRFDLARFHEMLLAYDGVPISLFHDELLSGLNVRFTSDPNAKKRPKRRSR